MTLAAFCTHDLARSSDPKPLCRGFVRLELIFFLFRFWHSIPHKKTLDGLYY